MSRQVRACRSKPQHQTRPPPRNLRVRHKPPLPALVSGAVGGDVVRGFGVVFALGGTGLTVGGWAKLF